MVRTILVAAAALAVIGCAAAKPKAAAPPVPDDAVVVSEIGLRTRLPGPDWKVVKNVVVKGGDGITRAFDLSFLNMRIQATITAKAYPTSEAGPAVMAQKLKDGFSAAGLTTSEVDFSDPRGLRADFAFRSSDAEALVNGRLAAVSLERSGVSLALIGVWPASFDAEGRRDMDAIVASMVAP